MDVLRQIGTSDSLVAMLLNEPGVPLPEALRLLSNREEAARLPGKAFADL